MSEDQYADYPRSPQGNVYVPKGPKVRFDVVRDAWNFIQPDLGTWIIAFLIIGVMVMTLSGIATMLTSPWAFQPSYKPNAQQQSVQQIVSFICGLIVWPFQANLFWMALKALRGEMISVGDLFNLRGRYAKLIGSYLLVTLFTLAGLLACILPVFFVTAVLSLTTFVVLDEEIAPMDALRKSYEALKSQWGSMFLLLLLLGLVMLSGFCFCGIGFLVTGPIGIVALAIVYADFFWSAGGSGIPASVGGPEQPPFPEAQTPPTE